MLSNLPPLAEDLLLVGVMALLATIILLSGKQDLTVRGGAISAWLEWAFGALLIGIRLYTSLSNARMVEFFGLLVVGGAYGYAIVVVFRRYLGTNKAENDN
jgi:hypothetical protein